MKLLILTLSLILAGCSNKTANLEIESEFIPYIQIYEQGKGSLINQGTGIHFEVLSDNLGAECHIFKDGSREIKVNSVYWNKRSFNHRRTLIVHELGHCDLNIKEHREGLLSNGRPLSIMQSVNFDATDEEMSYYFDELFGRLITTQGNP